MSLLSRLFGSGTTSNSTVEPETYKDMQIFAEPMAEGKTYRLAARITQDKDGDTREYQLIRADTFQDKEQAIEASAAKARQMIDEQGEQLFG